MSEMKCKRCGANENRIHGFCSMECETAWEYEDDIRDLTARIAELEEFKMIVEGCGFEVITEPPVLNHPERKILKGHGTIYVPTPPEVQE